MSARSSLIFVHVHTTKHSLLINLQDSDGRPSDFVALLLRQYQQEIEQFIGEMTQALADKRYTGTVHTDIHVQMSFITSLIE